MNVLKHGRSSLLLKLSITCGMVFATVQTQTISHAAEKNASAQKSNKVLLGTPELTSGIPGKGPLTKKEIKEWLSKPENHEILEVTLPLGLSAGAAQMVGLKENPLTRAKVELGRQLYFDTRLSSDNTISCASCHHPDEGYGRHTQFGIGVRDQEGGRNSPISYNRILSGPQFWDGRAATLEEQAVGPIENPIEMANTHETAVKTIKGIPGYQMQFKKIFKDGINIDNIGKAIAAFERTLVTGPSPFDYQEKLKPFLKMDKEDLEDLADIYQPILAQTKKHPMSKSALRGMDLFFSEKVNCAACHLGPNLTDEKYHNLGVGMDAKKPDLGRFEVTKQEKDKGAFKTPTIRNVEFSAPYMHDGSQQTLEEVVEHYNKGGTPNPYLSEKVKKLNLSDQDKKDLVAFMKACSGPFPKVETGRLPQ
ncbi:Cytochrome c551 peroxidase precursor [Gimesia fumaroli]|uniref:Cytochrome c551 peroxidase n=2 Tax=Gimesia fumaroli TaxID=2527976 RepID=A0A518I982_9PLAN|nr:cytochrome c peroxidase [Gimesia fumaroli]QDV49666.1 Cytochrome c551 peroxidase precursor [Gimesia fumaroli]